MQLARPPHFLIHVLPFSRLIIGRNLSSFLFNGDPTSKDSAGIENGKRRIFPSDNERAEKEGRNEFLRREMAQLQVTLIEGRDLKRKDRLSESDPFVRIYLEQRSTVLQSQAKQNSDNPQWNEIFVL